MRLMRPTVLLVLLLATVTVVLLRDRSRDTVRPVYLVPTTSPEQTVAPVRTPQTARPHPSPAPPPTAQAPSESRDINAIATPETQQVIAQMIHQVKTDLTTETFGAPGTLSYNIVYLFSQSLQAYAQFLKDFREGPPFHVFSHRNFSGRYNFRTDRIFMGQPTLQNSEGRFLTTLFHEYQHHLFHRIYGTPEWTDIVHKFYNELAAHLFEALFAVYLPDHYFLRPHRGRLPKQIVHHLRHHDGRAAMALIYDVVVREDSPRPVYRFLQPAWDRYISKEELLNTIDTTFHPDPVQADALAAAATDYWSDASPP